MLLKIRASWLLSYLLAAVISLCSGVSLATEPRLQVAFISPDPEVEGFWMLYKNVMLSAAKDLNIELEVVHSPNVNRFDHYDRVESVFSREDKPDYLVTLFLRNTSHKMLQAIEKSGIRFFATNSDIPDNVRQFIGRPRQIFKSWIGHARPDDYQAGELLAKTLLSQHRQASGSDPVNIIAVTGARDSDVTFMRNAGLKSAVEGESGVVLQQLLFTDWQYQTAYDYVNQLLSRYPQTQVIWCANDEIATAFIDAQKARGLSRTLLVGGIDWSYRGIGRFREGEMATSVGGHFIEGGLILALLRDHFDGVDFNDAPGTELMFHMNALNDDNIDFIESIVMKNNWQQLDFSLLSKSLQGHREPWHNNYLQLMKNIRRETD
jgi:ABC-type xylose transport system substrate-binding protein